MDGLWAKRNRRRGVARPPVPRRGRPLGGGAAQKQKRRRPFLAHYVPHTQKEPTTCNSVSLLLAGNEHKNRVFARTEKLTWRRALGIGTCIGNLLPDPLSERSHE